jgi:hypothetical protein
MIKLKKITEVYEEVEFSDDVDLELIDSNIEEIEVEDLEELKCLVKEFPHCSSSIVADDCARVWLTTDMEDDFKTGERIQYSMHFIPDQSKEALDAWRTVLRSKF